MDKKIVGSQELEATLSRIIDKTPVLDMHTHLFSPHFGRLFLSGIDELLTYHYLIAEYFSAYPEQDTAEFFMLPKKRQADLVWEALFVGRSPVSEAASGVITVLNRLGVDLGDKDLNKIRRWFAISDPLKYTEKIMSLAGVNELVMTNDPFNPEEIEFWECGVDLPSGFLTALRVDRLVHDYPGAAAHLKMNNTAVPDRITALQQEDVRSIQKYLIQWAKKLKVRYLMLSLRGVFSYPEEPGALHVLNDIILPFCIEQKLPLALMTGVKRNVNPAFKLAGDGCGRTDLSVLEKLIREHPQVRFMLTVLSREDLYGATVLSRKFPNLHLFGYWWFLNTPSLIRENTAIRLELLGTDFTAQHSDARVLEQLIYKWDHTRKALFPVLLEKYSGLLDQGWVITEEDLRRDLRALLGGNAEKLFRTDW